MTYQQSTSDRPDLDWSQINETVRMLNLAVAQIDMAMRQSDDSIGALTNSFTSMIGKVNAISTALDNLPCEEHQAEIELTRRNCAEIAHSVNHSIVAFQFYDKLSQRLDHVNHALKALSGLVEDQAKIYNPAEWAGLKYQIRSRYSMKEEQDMFDILLAGATIEEALDSCREKVTSLTSSEDDIELF